MMEQFKDMNYEPWGGDYIKAHVNFRDKDGNLLLKKDDVIKFEDFKKLPCDTARRYIKFYDGERLIPVMPIYDVN